MDYQSLYARRAATLTPALFRAGAASPAGVIPLTYGFPDPGSFPIEELIEAAGRMLRQHGRDALQYGPIAGPEPFLDLLVNKLAGEGISVSRQNLLVTAGGSQGIDLATHLLVDPGDAVIVEAPTFIGALQTFRNLEADLYEVPLDAEGMDTESLARLLAQLKTQGKRPKFIYTPHLPESGRNHAFSHPAGGAGRTRAAVRDDDPGRRRL
jgi:2-aminoadipate transaminase